MIRYFQKPLRPGYLHACTLTEMQEVLERLPPQDLEGIVAAGLESSTKRTTCNGRYEKVEGGAQVSLWSVADTYRYRMNPNTKKGRLKDFLAFEIHFGAKILEVGARLEVIWRPEDYRDFLLYHVLVHEVGHHVHYKERGAIWYPDRLPTHQMEQFAEHYAYRVSRKAFPEIHATLPRDWDVSERLPNPYVPLPTEPPE